MKEWREKHKDYKLNWQKNNIEHIKKYSKEYFDKNKLERNKYQKDRRHKLGISKTYIIGRKTKYITNEQKKEAKRLHRKKYKYNKKMAGKLSIDTIRLVYEDNIKKYGTLTCYLCEKVIETEKEHLEHKIPLSRGGTNNYDNLGIACSRCNCRKYDKTVVEYLEYLNKKEKNYK